MEQQAGGVGTIQIGRAKKRYLPGPALMRRIQAWTEKAKCDDAPLFHRSSSTQNTRFSVSGA